MYTETDLVSFGEYLLSRYRTQLMELIANEVDNAAPSQYTIDLVHHADLENWKNNASKSTD